MLLFHWYARCYIHLIGKFESEVTKGKKDLWQQRLSLNERAVVHHTALSVEKGT